MNLQQLITLYNKTHSNNLKSIQQIRTFNSCINSIIAFFSASSDIKKAFTAEKVSNYINFLQKSGLKNNTIRLRFSVLKNIILFAYHNNLILSVPFVKPPKKEIPEKTFISPKIILQMLQYCKQHNEPELRLIILIGFYTGMRIDNILSIKPTHIDNNYLRVWDNKTDNPYSIPIKRRLSHILSAEDFKPFTINYQQARYKFEKMKKALALDNKITLHTLRHTFCSRLVQKGINIRIIQQLANHKSITTTAMYTHIRNEDLEKAISVL